MHPAAPTPDQRAAWLARAAALQRPPNVRQVAPVALVQAVADAAAWQGWRMVPCGPPGRLAAMRLGRGATVLVDFGEHLVGHLELELASAGAPPDSPLRLRLCMSELPAEAAEAGIPPGGTISHAWYQDETVTLDELPAVWRLPRRLAGRYLTLQVVDTSPAWDLVVTAVRLCAVTGASHLLPPPPAGLDARLQAVDQVALRTLRNCMHTVFEDGPKRDRRLWTGDLRLQMLANGVSFRDTALSERSLCLLAAFTREQDGAFPACCFERPAPHAAADVITDYCLALPAILRELLRQGGDRALVAGLAPLARHQIALATTWLGSDGTVVPPPGWWTFIDWQEGLDRRAPLHGVLCWALDAWLGLAASLGLDPGQDAALLERLRAAGRQAFCSGPLPSWAAAAWLVLGGVLAGAEARRMLLGALDDPAAIPPGGPYLMHQVVHALCLTGEHARAHGLLSSYWGGMVERGADTFWEVYDAREPRRSPYRDFRLNSACHAWSCTPAWFLRDPQAASRPS
jgi:alpha-L-rhamnosidase